MWIEIDGNAYNTDLLAAVRKVGGGEKQCSLFMSGSSPIDGGFLINEPYDDVVQRIHDARMVELADMVRREELAASDPEIN